MATFSDESDLRAGPGFLPNGVAPAAPASPASRLPLAGGILLAVGAEALLALALAFFGSGHLLPVKLGVPIISALFALGSCLLVSMAFQGRERAAWVLMGLACLGILAAQSARVVPLFSGKGLAEGAAADYPSLASAALIAQSLGFFLAFLLFPPPTQGASFLARLGQFFDGVLVVGAALLAVIYFVLVPFAQQNTGPLTTAQLTTLAICVSDLLLLGGLTFALRSAGPRHSPLYSALNILGLAMLLLVAADFVSMVQTPNQLAPADSPLQAIWNAAYLIVGLGALRRLRSGNRASTPQAEAAIPEESQSTWLALPFVLTVVVAASIVTHAITRATTSTERLVALVCASLLVGLIGIRYLIGLFETRRLAGQRRALERKAELAEEQVEQLRSSQLAQARARQESLEYVMNTLTRFGYGDYQARVGALERDLAPLGDQLNALLNGVDRELNDRDRGRETRLIYVLADALGRLALGELHDLPELPAPGGSPLDGLMMSVVQVRARLMSLQGVVQQYEEEHYEARQELERARQELEEERLAQHQATLEMNQSLEGQLYSERQVAQATEEQWQRERQRLQAQAQAAETRVAEVEAMLHATEQRLVNERLEAEQRLQAERQALEVRQQEAARQAPLQLDDAHVRGEQLVRQFTAQAERLHTAAATLQTAAEVTQRLSQMIRETVTLPEIRGASQPAAATAQPPAAPQVVEASAPKKSLSALQMLERLAEGRGLDTTPKMPAVAPVVASASRTATGPLNESANERVARRLGMAAARADEIAGGLLELAMQCIQAGDDSASAAEEARNLTAELEPPKVPGVIPRTVVPARAPRARR
ncbi:MAG TPA: hypothetical protein VH590_20670 [Ktedonobacterales bacterium]